MCRFSPWTRNRRLRPTRTALPLRLSLLLSLLVLAAPFHALAAEVAALDEVVTAIDTIWVLLAAFLVFFMQAGFALVESGLTRSKNTGNIIMKNVMDFSVGSILYWIIGFALMFGVGNKFVGHAGLFTSGKFDHLGLGIPLPAFWLFQAVFAATAATIVSGAMAERTKYGSYLIYSAVISGLIYPIVGHWTWGGGWLADLGFIDFAGSTVVHSVGGWAALAGAMVLGPRLGRFNKDGSGNTIHGHNLLVAALGVFILWFGWFGFNPGSTLSAMDSSVAQIAVNTNLAAASGSLFAMIVSWYVYKKADVSMTLNGALAGLVAITAGCASVANVSSLIIGAIAGIVVVYASIGLEKLRIDDPVGAFPVHGVCGVLGTLLVGVFAKDGGLLTGGGVGLLFTQTVGVLATFVWTFPLAYGLFSILAKTVGLRVSELEELEGLDLGEHGHSAYPERMEWERYIHLLAPRSDLPR